jgi:DnaJ-class molecular chaperone
VIVFLIILAAAAFWALTLLVKPFGKCWLCRGKGNIVRKGKRKAPKCRACKGVGRRQRTGSRTVHRIRRQVAAHWRGPR